MKESHLTFVFYYYYYYRMAADSDGTLTAVVICEGDVRDPEFPKKFRVLLARLKALLEQPKSKKLKVNKV